jgi:iron complex outermembrane recepter protein
VAIDPLSARRVEVVRGPAALLYGSNALGGVVNVIRDEVPSTLMNGPHGSVSVQGQSVSRGGAAEGSIAGSVGRLALRAEGSGRWAGDTRTPLGSLENTSLGTYNAAVGAGLVGNAGHLGAAFRAYLSSYGVPPDTVTGHPHGVTVEMDRFTGRLKGELRPERSIFSNVRADASLTHYYHRELEAPRDEVRAGEPFLIGTEFELLTGALDVLAQHERLGPFSDGAVGFRAQWRDFATGGSLATPPATEASLAGFVFQEVDLRPLRLHLGARYDWTRVEPGIGPQSPTIGDVRTRSFGSVSGSIGFLYEVAHGVSVGTSASRAFRTPDINELFSEGPHLANYSFEIGNPDLGEETGLGVDVFGRVNRHDLRLELAVFHNRVRDYIYPRETGDSVGGLPVLRFSNDDATLQGGGHLLDLDVTGGRSHRWAASLRPA